MPGKRQHYVPRFLLRRFAIDPADKKSYIYRLEKSTGRPLRVNPLNEAVIGRYYRIVLDDGTVIDAADEALDRIEAMAAEVVPKVADPGYVVSGEHAYILMLFIASLKNRTPQMRESLRETDEQAAELAMEQMLSDRERYHQRPTPPRAPLGDRRRPRRARPSRRAKRAARSARRSARRARAPAPRSRGDRCRSR